MTPDFNKLLTSKQLASELGRCLNYVYAMRRHGFQMPGGRATMNEARAFLLTVKYPMSEKDKNIRKQVKTG